MEYLYRHNKIGTCLHWLILRNNGIRVCELWLNHVPLYTTTKGEVKIYWGTPLFTNKMVKFSMHDIVIWNDTEQTAQFIDRTAPQDYNMVSATANKIIK